MHGFLKTTRRRRQSSRRHFRHGQRAAALRALTGARLYINQLTLTLVTAAESTGSSVGYVQAAVTLLRSENSSLVGEVLAGRIPLPASLDPRLANLRHVQPQDGLAACAFLLGPLASSATAYAWLVWDRAHSGPTVLHRIFWMPAPANDRGPA